MKLKLRDKVKLRNGSEGEVVLVDDSPDYPVRILYTELAPVTKCRWVTAEGKEHRSQTESDFDVVEVLPLELKAGDKVRLRNGMEAVVKEYNNPVYPFVVETQTSVTIMRQGVVRTDAESPYDVVEVIG